MQPDATEPKHSPARIDRPAGSIFFVPGECVNLQPRISMTTHKNDQASVRIWAHNPDHHLYNNNGTWWLHYTAYPTPLTTQRLRRSLKTRDVTLARSRRDAVLAQLFSGRGGARPSPT